MGQCTRAFRGHSQAAAPTSERALQCIATSLSFTYTPYNWVSTPGDAELLIGFPRVKAEASFFHQGEMNAGFGWGNLRWFPSEPVTQDAVLIFTNYVGRASGKEAELSTAISSMLAQHSAEELYRIHRVYVINEHHHDENTVDEH